MGPSREDASVSKYKFYFEVLTCGKPTWRELDGADISLSNPTEETSPKTKREINGLSLVALREVLSITECLPEVNIPECIMVLLHCPVRIRKLF